MKALGNVLHLPVHLEMILMDVAIFFLFIRLLTQGSRKHVNLNQWFQR